MNRKRWIAIALAVGIGVVLWTVLSGSPARVEVATVGRDTLTVGVSEEGRTRFRDRYVVAAPVTGRVSRTDLEEGDSVRAGQVLARMAPPPIDSRTTRSARADLDVARAGESEARAALGAAERTAEQARREHERRIPLFEMGAISRESLERAEEAAESAVAAAARARASLAAAEGLVEAARARLLGGDADEGGFEGAIRSPVAGVVMRVAEKSERVVQAGTPLFEISGAGGLEFVVDLLTEEAVRVSPGDTTRITGWGGDAELGGRVRYIEPAAFTEVSALGVEEQRVNVVGDLFDPPPGLGTGFRLDVEIVVWSDPDALVVPTSAIFQQDGGWHLFAVEGGRARLRAVEIGRRGTDVAEVLSGVSEGDAVVVFPSDRVEDGIQVTSNRSGG